MNIQFLRTIALISNGKLSHLTYRWKGGTSFTLEQIASILYRIERKRAKFAGKALSVPVGIIAAAICLVGLYEAFPYALSGFMGNDERERLIATLTTYLMMFVFGGGIMFGIVRGARRLSRRMAYHYVMAQKVPTSYATELKKFSDALQEALKHLGSDLRSIIQQHRDEIAAQAATLLEAKAMEIVRLEEAQDDNSVNDEIYDLIEAEASDRRDEFKQAYTALAALSLVGGGYTNFFRRAQKELEKAMAA